MPRRSQAHDAPSGTRTLLQAAPPNPSAPRLPGLVGRYRPVRLLGQGGMGIVYLAQDPALRRWVALKLIRGQITPEELARFQREAQLAARLRHPAIAAVLDSGLHQGAPFLVMELVPGESLRERLRREGPLEGEEAARIVAALADALQHAHEAGVLHRDLKPANVLLDRQGQPRLVDFGLARTIAPSDSGVTATGQILGTPAFMSPEQASGERDAVDARSDVWGLGAVLYQLLTGSQPFPGESALQVLEAVLAADPHPPTRLRPDLARELEAICLRCLEKEPAARYPSAGALGDDLRRWLRGEPVQARRGGLQRWARRHGPRTAALLLVGLASIGLARAGSGGHRSRAEQLATELAGAAAPTSLRAAETALGLGLAPGDLAAVGALGQSLPPAARRAAAERLARRARALLTLDPDQAARWGQVAARLDPAAPEALYAQGRAAQALRAHELPLRMIDAAELRAWYGPALEAGSAEARARVERWGATGEPESQRALAALARELPAARGPEGHLLDALLLPQDEAEAALRAALAAPGDPELALHARAQQARLLLEARDVAGAVALCEASPDSPLLDVWGGLALLLQAQAHGDRDRYAAGQRRLSRAAARVAALPMREQIALADALFQTGRLADAAAVADPSMPCMQRLLAGLGQTLPAGR